MSVDIAKMQDEAYDWTQHNFSETWTAGDPKHQMMGMTEELGEMMHARLKYEQKVRGYDRNKMLTEMEDAMADLFIYMCDTANRLAIDLDTVIAGTWNKVKERDWTSDPARK